MNKVNEVLNKAAVVITNIVSTMWCALAFALLALLGFPTHGASARDYVQWVSQTFIQLVMLSVIMVGQKQLDKRHDEHAEQLNNLHRKLGAK
jgi:surfactin synthase thioesterase subunit